jgi:hypothetical protein
MGSCLSVEADDGGERKEPTRTSQLAPAGTAEPAAPGVAHASASFSLRCSCSCSVKCGSSFLGFAYSISRFLSLTTPP